MGSQHQELISKMATTTNSNWRVSLLALGFVLSMVNLSLADDTIGESLRCNTDEDTEFTTVLGYFDSRTEWRSHKSGKAYKNGAANEYKLTMDLPANKYIIVQLHKFGVRSESNSDYECATNYVEFEIPFLEFVSKRFCGAYAKKTLFKLGPFETDDAQLIAKFVRVGNEYDIIYSALQNFRIKMYWIEDGDQGRWGDISEVPELPE